MSAKLSGFRRGRGRRFWFLASTVAVAAASGIVFVAASGAVLPGSPSGFEANDGNMTLDTSGNTDWNCFQGANGFATLSSGTPVGCKVTSGATQLTADANSETTWVNGQKFDTQCPALQTGTVPNKDDFTNVASYSEIASNNDAFFYGATIRSVANGDSSGDVEFNQASGNGTTTAGCRTAGDLLLAYDFSVGGTSLDFHILTWIDSTNPTAGGNNGTCFVQTDSMPCWGANELTPVTTEGEANQLAIAATDNGISGSALVAQRFAEFGVNLTQALGLTGSCLAFPQLVWESRSSGSSFTSNPEDIEIEHETIDTCAQPTLTTKLSKDSILNTGSVTDTASLAGATADASGAITISVYSGSDSSACVAGNFVTSMSASPSTNGNGDYSATFSGLAAGSYEFQASIAADAKNLSATSACGTEPLTVQNQPTLTTKQNPAAGNAGDTYNDTAHLTGGASPTGTITFKLYSNNDCSGLLDTETATVSGNGDYSTPTGFKLDSPGTYYWVATYNGDSNNLSAATGCADEPVTVNAAEIHILKTADAAQVNAGEDIGFTLTVYNSGSGDAHGVTLTDTLPSNPGLSWSIDKTGTGWGSTCGITAGVLTCGPVTVPAGTTLALSSFTVHITSHTTTDTGGVCPVGSGLVTNTGDVSTTNDGTDQSTATTCVAAPAIHILKTADAAKVNVGSPIGFTLTVWNDGSGDAHGVTLTDTLPSNPGLSWSIDKTGTGWGSSCSIAAGTLSCGPVTVPAGTTEAASTFTVHVVSGTAAATGGDCPKTGVVDNTGNVTTSNDGSGQSSATTCVQALVDLSITKSGAPATQVLGSGNITWTMVVTNNGPDADTGVTIADPMPAGNTFVSATTTKGSCTGGAVLNCTIGDMAAGESVTITLVTTPSTVGNQVNTVKVVGDRPETNTANNTATATVVTTPQVFPPPVVFCVAVSKITPNQLFVGRKTVLTIHLTKHSKAAAGYKVRIKGPKVDIVTKRSNGKGIIKKTVKLKKAGILIFTPLASKRCNTKRIGVTGVFTPPVTG